MKKNENDRLEIKLNPDEKMQIKIRANRAKLTMTEYVKRRVLYSKEKRVKDLISLVEVITEITELLRKIEAEYGTLGPDIRERIEKIWVKLSCL